MIQIKNCAKIKNYRDLYNYRNILLNLQNKNKNKVICIFYSIYFINITRTFFFIYINNKLLLF